MIEFHGLCLVVCEGGSFLVKGLRSDVWRGLGVGWFGLSAGSVFFGTLLGKGVKFGSMVEVRFGFIVMKVSSCQL